MSLDILSLKEQQLQHEVVMLRRRIRKLHCLLRLLLTMLRLSELNLAKERVPEGKAKATLLRAVDRTWDVGRDVGEGEERTGLTGCFPHGGAHSAGGGGPPRSHS